MVVVFTFISQETIRNTKKSASIAEREISAHHFSSSRPKQLDLD